MAIECNGFRTQTVLELFPMQNSSKWEFINMHEIGSVGLTDLASWVVVHDHMNALLCDWHQFLTLGPLSNRDEHVWQGYFGHKYSIGVERNSDMSISTTTLHCVATALACAYCVGRNIRRIASSDELIHCKAAKMAAVIGRSGGNLKRRWIGGDGEVEIV
ncbi:hypothetical protein An11g01680 [Aspergillus niger]|uniref:Uncharacterized protein n=2 Tax=Aspergillus niger TaxID=5061 RepID=A2QVJ8_ASPNC|nr:hypothetical protein An11g01680 [Aspergillus niger]CAK45902.1 hypothetical protein An11g01680 [Aspergillus niger]